MTAPRARQRANMCRDTSLKIGRLEHARAEAGWLELEIRSVARLGERLGETHFASGQALIVFDFQQDVRWPTALRNEDRVRAGPTSWRCPYVD